jgi:hypothetical protein
MLPVILVAVGAYLIGDSVLGDKKSFAKGGMMAKGGEVKFYEGQSVIYPSFIDKKMDKSVRDVHNKFANKELVIDKITIDKPFNTAKVFDRNTGEKAPFDLILDSKYVEQYADGGITDADKAMKEGYMQQVVEIATKAHDNGIKANDRRKIVLRIADMMRSYFKFEKENLKETYGIENSKFQDLESGDFDEIKIKRGNDELIIEKDKEDYITFNGKKYHNKDLFKKGDKYYFADYNKTYSFQPRGDEGARWGLEGQVHDIGTDGLDSTLFIYMFDNKNDYDKFFSKSGMMAKGGKLVGKQKKLDVNKNGKLDAEDFKMLRGEKMAKGGETKMPYKEFEETLREYEIEGGFGKIKEKGYEMYYLPNGNPYLNTKFNHRNKKKAYQQYVKMDR